MSEVAAPAAAPAAPAASSTPAPAPSAATVVPPAPKAAPKAPAAPAAPAKPAEPEMWDVPVNGKVKKMAREEAIKRASLADQAFGKFEEAAAIRKEAEAKLERFKTPKEAIRFLNDPENGLNLKPDEVRAAFEEWYSESFIAPTEMTAEQLRIAELEKQNKKYEQDRAKEAEAKKKADDAENDRLGMIEMQKHMTSMLEEAGLPKTKFTASRLAYWIRVNEAKGINAPKEMIIQQVQKETGDIVKALAGVAGDGEKLVSILGEDIVKRIRQYDLARIRAKRGGLQNPLTPETVTETKTPEKISMREVRRRAREFR